MLAEKKRNEHMEATQNPWAVIIFVGFTNTKQ